MKKIFLFCLVLISGLVSGQGYKLFNAHFKKLFTEYPVNQRGYSLSFDTVLPDAADSIYCNYFNVNDAGFISDTCMFWTGPMCRKQNMPSWIGQKFST